MSSHYLDRLRISPEERARLAGLGAPTPLAVLGIRKAAPEAFDGLFGTERASEIAAQLAGFLGEGEQAILEAPLPPPYPLGARLDEPPEPPPRLRRSPVPSKPPRD